LQNPVDSVQRLTPRPNPQSPILNPNPPIVGFT